MGNYNTRDGAMTINGNGGGHPNYEPNSYDWAPKEDKSFALSKQAVTGSIGRYPH